MPTNLTVILKDEPGQLASLGEATGTAGVNIEGLCAFTGEGLVSLIREQVEMGVAVRMAVLEALARHLPNG